MAETKGKSKVLVTSDGTRTGTKVVLVVEDSEGHKFSYRIPHVRAITWKIDVDRYDGNAVATLEIGEVEVSSSVKIGHNNNTSIEDLMAEIAAARLRSSDK